MLCRKFGFTLVVMAKIFLNDGWQYSPSFSAEKTMMDYAGDFETVRIPHAVAVTPFNSFPTEIYQKNSIYRRTFRTESGWKEGRVLLTVEGAAHCSEVFVNGRSVALHECGYTAFTVDLTDFLADEGGENVLAIRVDSRESLNQPPFGFVVDYMTYGGIYRDVYLDIRGKIRIDDVFVMAADGSVSTEVTVVASGAAPDGLCVRQKVVPADGAPMTASSGTVLAEFAVGVDASSFSGGKSLVKSRSECAGAEKWDVDSPFLYTLVTELVGAFGEILDESRVRFGFRSIRFDETGFYLNGRKIRLRGLNRHQSWPYIGYAAPKSMQREDADILKYELGLNEVRTSHYPQGRHFVDRCDEIGLLVFTEIPGWQHIGDGKWKDVAVENVRDMVLQYRNHPSVFIWGVRINESQDDDEFYARTNAVAHSLDSTRPTGGVRFLKHSSLLEDVYTFNDFSFHGPNDGCLPKKRVTDTRKGFMVTEYNGHMFPTKTFDCERLRTEHALRHAKVLDALAARADCAGGSGWCAFDYNTHKDFGSGDYICYHGVMDMFRNPKMAAFVYASQQDVSVSGDILDVTSSMDIGEHPGGARGDVFIITNADSVRMYVNDIFIKEYTAADSPFRNLPHGPILIDDYIGHRIVDEDGVPERNFAAVKSMLFALQKYGVNRLPLKVIMKGLLLWARGVTNPEHLRKLYGKYIGNWGGESVVYRFDSYRGGKFVRSVTREPMRSVSVKAFCRRTALREEETYDMAQVCLRAVDQNGNVQPFCQEAVTLRTEGAVELVGPSAVSLKGGMAGTYVRTAGGKGRGSLVVKDWTGTESRVEFDVE